jgi:FkbM family methyltransferase
MSAGRFLRIERFLESPWEQKRIVLRNRFTAFRNSLISKLTLIKRLDPGFLWIAWSDVIREQVLAGNFERAELNFVCRFLKPGMTVLDVGAYYGLYTMTASIKVGDHGQVIAFEPAPYQMKRLRWHLMLNRLSNVKAEALALGDVENDRVLFSVPGRSAGYTSLRRFEIEAAVMPIPVKVTTLDNYLRKHCVNTVDFIKVDVEGGELDVFRGAAELFRHSPRPVVLCELEDIRTKNWGHSAKDCAEFLESLSYRWFSTQRDGSLLPIQVLSEVSDRNFVAVPEERIPELKELIKDASSA